MRRISAPLGGSTHLQYWARRSDTATIPFGRSAARQARAPRWTPARPT